MEKSKMDHMKQFLIYLLMIIGIFILSEFLIHVSTNSIYKDIKREDTNSQIEVYQAQATRIDGRIRGIIKNIEEIQNKDLKIELYSKRGILLNTQYIEIQKSDENTTQPFELLFKIKNVESYKIEIVEHIQK